MFSDHPVVGVGAGNYTAHYLDYAADIGLLRSGEQLAPHSLLTEVASETGVLGLIAFGSIVAGCVRARFAYTRARCWRSAPFADARLISAIRIALTGYLVAGLFLHAAYPHILWLLLALAWATPQTVPTPDGRRRRRTAEEQPEALRLDGVMPTV